MAGRKPLPTHLKMVKGTARPQRTNAEEPKPIVILPIRSVPASSLVWRDRG